MPRKKTDLSQRLEAVIKTLVPQQEQNPDDLGPMMRAIKAVHSISDHTSTTPEDLEHQRAAQELFGRLVTPSIGIRNDSLTVGSIPAEWVSLEHGHDRHHAVLYCHGGGYTSGNLGYARVLASKLAHVTGYDVLSFEYRLAPEHPYPAAIEDAVLDGHGLTAAEEDGAQVAVGVHAGVVARLIDIAAELRMDGAGVTVLMLLGEVGDHLAHDVEQIMLQVFQIERVDVVRALLDHDGAGGVVRRDAGRAVLDAGFLDDLNDLTGDIVEGGDPAAGLQLELFLINLEFHCV